MSQPAAIEDELDIPDPKIGKVCRELIAQNKKITIRSVAERTGVAHTTYSRDPKRKAQITRAQEIQRLAWTIKRTHRGQAEPHESVAIARLRKRLEETEAHKQLLIASHRAMLSAVGEMGGTRAWLRFFAKDPNALASLIDTFCTFSPFPTLSNRLQPCNMPTSQRSTNSSKPFPRG
jgi:hypothetical protein